MQPGPSLVKTTRSPRRAGVPPETSSRRRRAASGPPGPRGPARGRPRRRSSSIASRPPRPRSSAGRASPAASPASRPRNHSSLSRERLRARPRSAPARSAGSPSSARCITRRNAAPGTLQVRQRISRVSRSITNASPKLFAMKATRRLSGEKSARSPKRVRISTFGGRWSRGLSVRRRAVAGASSSSARRAQRRAASAYSRCARLGWWPGTNMSCHFRSSFFCISSGYDQSPRSFAPPLFVPKVNFAPRALARRRKPSLGIL